MSRRPKSALLASLCLFFLLMTPVKAQVVRAALVNPWGSGITNPVGPFWDDLSNNWSAYGSTQLILDRTTFVTAPVTAAALAQTNPDVLVFADSSWNGRIFSPQERTDITNFLASGGKRIVGTYVTFQYLVTDNRWLLPLFGLDPGLTLTLGPNQTQALDVLAPSSAFMNGLPNPIPMSGWTDSQFPSDLSWDPSDLGGTLIAASPNRTNIFHHAQGANHDAVYISFMPEYGGDALARQLVYNAIAQQFYGVTITPLASPSIGTVLPLSLA
ncbi:MAG TPA: hypothetical protein PKA37_17570, partial [Planctomycetota bacterium]|nr:hypothetical protein [Planctomycetota bacterium]